MAEASARPSQEATATVQGASDRGHFETSRPRKPILVKPQVQPKKESVEFYVAAELT
jgi:hypothetical protein